MKVSWPFGVALRRGFRPPHAALAEDVVVSDEEKAPAEASGGDREGERERIVADGRRPNSGVKGRRGSGFMVMLGDGLDILGVGLGAGGGEARAGWW